MVRIGTFGWHYGHWRGPFYPSDLPLARMLDFYSHQFDTVELNNSFYKLPTPAAFEEWKRSTPKGFLFAVKASRYITHMKKLKEGEASFERFHERVVELGAKLGPILFQLPPHWGPDPARLDEFLGSLPRRRRYAFELRDPSWFTAEIEAVLRRHRAGFCIYDFDRRQSPLTITADFVYMRLHGPEGRYAGSYSERELERWQGEIAGWSRAGLDVYCYFDNDQAGYAARDALRLKKRMGSA